MNKTLASILMAASLCGFSVQANEYDAQIKDLYKSRVAAMVGEQSFIEAIRSQNAKHEGLDSAAIDTMDKAWRGEVGAASHPTIDGVLTSPLSEHLRGLRDSSEGLFTEIFVMDGVGLNVAASDVTSDYWQGDEAKWQKTFAMGPDAIHISEVELDESTQQYQIQLSVAIVDPDTGKPIGAATFGVNVEYLN